jgi:hypothetical protein
VDRASGPIDRIRQKFTDLGKAGGAQNILTGVGLGIGARGFDMLTQAAGRAVDVIQDAIKGAIEEEAGIAKLDAALKANVKGWDGNTAAIESTIKARMRLGFTDDEQRDSLAKLVAATKDVGKALDIQRTAMDLARIKGVDLGTASTALAKALGGQTKGLKELVPELKAGASATEILAEAQRVAAGQAEAYAEKTGGKLLGAQIKISEALENLATKILPLVAEGADLASEGADHFSNAIDLVGKAASEAAPAVDLLHRADEHLWNSFRILIPGLALAQDGIQDLTESENQNFDAMVANEKARGEMVAGMQAQADAVEEAKLANLRYEASLSRQDKALLDSQRAFGVFGDKVRTVARAVKTNAVGAAGAFANALEDSQSTTSTAINEAIAVYKKLPNALNAQKRIIYLTGFLSGKQYADGITSADPYIRAKFEDAGEHARQELAELNGSFGKLGSAGGSAYATAFLKAVVRKFKVKIPGINVGDLGGGNAMGGPNRPQGGWTGENGPEYRTDTTTFPDMGSAGFAGAGSGGGGGGALIFNYSPTFGSASAAEMQRAAQVFVPAMVREMQRQGFLVRRT